MDLGDHKTLHQKVRIRAYLGKRRGVVIGERCMENDKDVSGKERRRERGGKGTGGREWVKEHEMRVIN